MSLRLLIHGLLRNVSFTLQNAGTSESRASIIVIRGFSFHARGRPKLEIIRNQRQEEEHHGIDRLKYNPRLVVTSEDGADSDPDSLARRLEDAPDESAVSVLRNWIGDGKETQEGIVAAMKWMKYLGRFKDALEISNFVMQERRADRQKFHYLNHLELLGRVQSMRSAERFLRKMPRQFSRTEEAQMVMFNNYITHESVHGASLVLRCMKEEGYLETAEPFNKLLGLCAKKQRVEKIPHLLRDMKRASIPADVETYNVLITAKAKKGDVYGMEALLGKLKQEKDGTADAAVCCSLASGYVNAGKFAEAANYLKQVVEDEKFKQSRKYHDVVIALYAAMGQVEEVDRIWKFSKEFPAVSATSYIATIAAYEKVGQVEKAEEVFTEVEARKKSIGTRYYNALLQIYTENNQMHKAEKLMERMVRNSCRPDMGTYHHLIAGYIRSGNQEKALEMMDKVLDEHLTLSSQTMMLVLELHAENGDVHKAEQLFQHMRREGYSYVQAYNALLKAYVGAGKHAFRFLQRMAADKVHPNKATFELLDQMQAALPDSVLSGMQTMK